MTDVVVFDTNGNSGHRGRHKGVLNKRPRVTRPRVAPDVRILAQGYGQAAIKELAWLLRNSESEEVRLRAADLLLMRGYGRPPVDVNVVVKRDVDDFTDAELALLVGQGRLVEGGEVVDSAAGSAEELNRVHEIHEAGLHPSGAAPQDSGETG